MKDFDSLVGIWNEQKTAPVIDYKEVISHYKESRGKLRSKFTIEIIAMMLALGVVTYVLFTTDFQFWTSYIGLVIVQLCCLYFIIMQIINIISFSVISLVIGILALVFYNDPRVKSYFHYVNGGRSPYEPVPHAPPIQR